MTRMPRSKVTIIFPTYNGWQDTLKCLTSFNDIDYPKNKIEIVVIDNNSSDSTVTSIKKMFPKVKVLKQHKNLGYSKAVNIGIKKSVGKYILLSNNDVVLRKDYLRSMVDLAETDLSIGIIGSMVYLNKSGGKLGFDGLRVNPYLGYHQYDLNNLNKVRECDIPPAGGFFIRRSLLKKIGPLDEGFFLYYEDLDLCIRAKKAGFKIIYNPYAVCYHNRSKTSYREFALEEIIYIGYKSKWRCILKHANLLQILSSLIFQFTIAIVVQNMRSSIKTFHPMIKGVFWNIRNLKQTLKIRRNQNLL